MKFHIAGFLMGCILDLIFGDPRGIPHPVIGIGKIIAFFDRVLLKNDSERNKASERFRGVILVVAVLTVSVGISYLLLLLCYGISSWLGLIYEAVVTWLLLALKDLKIESMLVYEALKLDDIEGARYAVSRIVGRDTENLDKAGITRAAVETAAENLSDGVIAPMLFLAIGGPAGGVFYKAVNTMDSMVGYKNERYMYFGTAAAKLDDIVNFLPSRISALLMIIAAIPGREFNAVNAWKIFLRDRFNHKSPNSAQTESAAAGALGIKLGGDSFYFGKLVHKDTIGDSLRDIETDDIRLANVLNYRAAFLAGALCTGLMFLR